MATPPPVLPPYPVRADGQSVFSEQAEDWNAAMKDDVVPYFYTAASETEAAQTGVIAARDAAAVSAASAAQSAMDVAVVSAVFNSTIAGILGVGTQILIDPRDSGPVYQDPAQTIPGGIGLPIGSIGRVVRATQATTSLKPLLQANYVQFDFVDDLLTYPSGGMPETTSIYATPFGWMRSTSPLTVAPTSRVPGGLLRLYAEVSGTLTGGQVTALNAYLGTSEGTFVGMTTDSTVFHRIASVSGPFPITYVGANGVTYVQTADNVTTDLIAQGLTSPFAMFIPANVKTTANVTAFDLTGNGLSGLFPQVAGNTSLTSMDVSGNQITGPIPPLTTNTSLTAFRVNSNQLTGSIPSLTNNTSLTIVNFGNNQLTGAVPSLATNNSLANINVSSNQLSSWVGGTVSINLGAFTANNNLFPAATVNALLAAFVAANRTTGTRTLNLGGTGNAAPTGQGLTDKATLQSRGWTVTTN